MMDQIALTSKLRASYQDGRMWAKSFWPLGKLANVDDEWFDHDSRRVTKALKLDDQGTKIISLKKYLKADRELSEMEEMRHKAGSAADNMYLHGSLRTWDKHGVKLARRIEIQDDRICALCRVKNGETYDVSMLLSKDLPLTFDTHPKCRGSFIPIIGSITMREDHVASDEHVVTMVLGGTSIEDMPIEYKPFIVKFVGRLGKLPFKIKFDKEAKFDYKFDDKLLTINPRATDHVEPREIIARCMARQIWPDHEAKFRKEYGTLLKLGLVHPNRASQTWPDLFENTYTEFKLNQLDEPYEVLWCKANLAA